MTTTHIKSTKLFEISAGWNSLLGKFNKDERLSVYIVERDNGFRMNGKDFQVQVLNADGLVVNRILKYSLTNKTAIGWAKNNFGHQKVA